MVLKTGFTEGRRSRLGGLLTIFCRAALRKNVLTTGVDWHGARLLKFSSKGWIPLQADLTRGCSTYKPKILLR